MASTDDAVDEMEKFVRSEDQPTRHIPSPGPLKKAIKNLQAYDRAIPVVSNTTVPFFKSPASLATINFSVQFRGSEKNTQLLLNIMGAGLYERMYITNFTFLNHNISLSFNTAEITHSCDAIDNAAPPSSQDCFVLCLETNQNILIDLEKQYQEIQSYQNAIKMIVIINRNEEISPILLKSIKQKYPVLVFAVPSYLAGDGSAFGYYNLAKALLDAAIENKIYVSSEASSSMSSPYQP